MKRDDVDPFVPNGEFVLELMIGEGEIGEGRTTEIIYDLSDDADRDAAAEIVSKVSNLDSLLDAIDVWISRLNELRLHAEAVRDNSILVRRRRTS